MPFVSRNSTRTKTNPDGSGGYHPTKTKKEREKSHREATARHYAKNADAIREKRRIEMQGKRAGVKAKHRTSDKLPTCTRGDHYGGQSVPASPQQEASHSNLQSAELVASQALTEMLQRKMRDAELNSTPQHSLGDEESDEGERGEESDEGDHVSESLHRFQNRESAAEQDGWVDSDGNESLASNESELVGYSLEERLMDNCIVTHYRIYRARKKAKGCERHEQAEREILAHRHQRQRKLRQPTPTYDSPSPEATGRMTSLYQALLM
ncbi:hypothetical protein B0H10DRAFT_2184034 [Mycena sp. CBHHK59/15]|nr:hypothetical protein B0H10DRAFT_2192814 [Mycena sp. CBHHK59/15]KAJ6629972.1 hypothetical protein B0H10DRAFT_2184034 [Mycena sp. CBHHK59/15]